MTNTLQINLDVNGCKRCMKRFGNPGSLTVFSKTESDAGGYYPAHVHCDQCRKDGPGRETVELAVSVWNKLNPTTKIKPRVYPT